MWFRVAGLELLLELVKWNVTNRTILGQISFCTCNIVNHYETTVSLYWVGLPSCIQSAIERRQFSLGNARMTTHFPLGQQIHAKTVGYNVELFWRICFIGSIIGTRDLQPGPKSRSQHICKHLQCTRVLHCNGYNRSAKITLSFRDASV
jgi:hypothetical protein